MRKILTIDKVRDRITKLYKGIILLDETTYINTKTKARFIDKDFGEWWALPKDVFRGHVNKERGNIRRIQSNMVKYGTEYPAQCNAIKLKIINTNLERYGVTNPLKNDKIKIKVQNTCKERYGFNSSLQSDIVKKKIIYANLKKYGSEYPQQNKEISKKRLNTNLKRYGFTSPAKNDKIMNKIIKTNLRKYGVKYAQQNKEISDKRAKSSNNSYTLYHWKTGEELTCVASYEKAVVEYLNKNKINFRWQSKTFKMLNGHTYRPDLYLFSTKKWIEIKGYFWGDAEEKWNWFHSTKPNSELWDKQKLKEMRIL